ncbi:outer membrane protein [Microvirga terrestris]|uniref:Porin family protein n=1 Tax=Microvirga terrestris TaxID=2791024 RepID=A0ABS0HTD8_9HYPH|nr:porin family protein [Microvirga terrestris]MBF9196750.1 porin family protein [Microvirga terrestris]
MRKCVLSLLTGVAGITLAAAAASAADLPARAAPPAPIIAAAPIFTWTGFYAGVNAGWGWRSDDQQTVILGGATPGTLNFDNNSDGGFTGGAQIGYNYQIGSFVIGLETDIQWADTDQNVDVAFVPAGAPGTFVPGTFDNNLSDWFGTVRARAGVAFDRVLIYATGGLAYTDDNTGWVAGGGVEWALPVNWFGSSAVTFGVEGLWLSFDEDDDFGGTVGTFTPAGGGAAIPVVAPDIGNDDNDFFVARAKLNFKFGTY